MNPIIFKQSEERLQKVVVYIHSFSDKSRGKRKENCWKNNSGINPKALIGKLIVVLRVIYKMSQCLVTKKIFQNAFANWATRGQTTGGLLEAAFRYVPQLTDVRGIQRTWKPWCLHIVYHQSQIRTRKG